MEDFFLKYFSTTFLIDIELQLPSFGEIFFGPSPADPSPADPLASDFDVLESIRSGIIENSIEALLFDSFDADHLIKNLF